MRGMEIIETHHAILSAYEVLQVVKMRSNERNQFKDGRDIEVLGNGNRIKKARSMLMDSLLVHSPDDTAEQGNDNVGESIVNFSNSIQSLIEGITPLKIANLIAIRPTNPSELAAIFSTVEDWSMVADRTEELFELINICFPRKRAHASE